MRNYKKIFLLISLVVASYCSFGQPGDPPPPTGGCPPMNSVIGGGTICSQGPGATVSIDGSAAGVSYQLKMNGMAWGGPITGTGSAISWTDLMANGMYTVDAQNGTCTLTMSGSAVVTVNPVPTAYSTGGGGAFCSGGTGVTVTLTGSQSGINYQLKVNGTNSGAAVAGTGSSLSWTNRTTAGTYTVIATNTSTGCFTQMNSIATVTVNALPTTYTVAGGGSLCSGGTGVTVTLSGSQSGVNYQLKINGSNSGSAIAGTGSGLSWANQATNGTYTVVATNATTSCTATMTGSATVTVNALPTTYTVAGGGSLCSGGTGVTVTLSGSQSGVNYQLKINGSNSGSAIAGTGSGLSWANQTTAGTYTVVATNATTSCTATMTGSATVSVNALPTTYIVAGGGSLCSGGTGVTVTLSGSQSGVNYQLKINGSNSGSTIAGTGSALSWTNQTTNGTYTVVATNATTSCAATMTGSATVIVNALPTADTVASGGSLCSGGTGVAVTLSGSKSGVNYQLKINGNNSGSAIAGTGSGLSWANQTTAGTYTVVATNATTGCTAAMTGSAMVTVNTLPAVYTVGGGGLFCAGGAGVSITLSGSQAGVNYQLKVDGNNSGSPKAGTGSVLTWSNQTIGGAYTVTASDATTACVAMMSGTRNIIVNPLPTVFTLSGGGSLCTGTGVPVTLNGSQTNVSYQLKKDNVNFGASLAGTGGTLSWGSQQQPGTYTVIAISSSGCIQSMTGSATVTGTTNCVIMTNWSFQYKYDSRKRMTHKKIPGADWVYMVYDSRDRLVMTQDGNQRAGNKWTFTWYDQLNRPVMTGLYTHGSTVDQAGMSALISSTAFSQTFDGTGTFFGYTNTATSSLTGAFEPLTITYYDNYDFVRNDPYFVYRPAELTGQYNYSPSTAFPYVVGQVTGTWTRFLGPDRQWMRSVNYYDDKGRIVQNITDNQKRGQDVTTNVFDFVGRITASKTTTIDHHITWTNVNPTVTVQEDRLSVFLTNVGVGAVSSQQIPANTDGWVEFTVSSSTQVGISRYFGLSSGSPPNTGLSIGYGVHQSRTNSGWTLQALEAGAMVSSLVYADAGDVIRVERRGMTMYYTRNGVEFWHSTVTSRPALVAHGALTYNAELYNPRISVGGTTHAVERHFEYDHAGRLLKTWHATDGNAPVLLTQNEYNELGQLVDRKLHSTNGTSFEQSIDYRYNIRGWLTSINGAQLDADSEKNTDSPNSGRDLFGIDLLYNGVNAGLNNRALYNGNISAMRWSNSLGLADVKERAYNFGYDAMNRLESATQKTFNMTWAPSNAYHESGLTYDLNGNIKTLLRTDEDGVLMDSLKYDYGTGDRAGNMLRKVTDAGTPSGFSDVTGSGDDYAYDNNGNLILDRNKTITSITYNYLNLPEKVTKSTGEFIMYIYDATGRKLIQSVYNGSNTIKKRSYYTGEWFYENDTLKFTNHEEGRVVMTGATPEYQYHLKDHLGNVRMTFTTKDELDSATATLERDKQLDDRSNFLNYDDARLVYSQLLNHTRGDSVGYSQRLSGSANEKIGLAKSLSVMPGDVITAEVYAKYFNRNDQNLAAALQTVVNYLLNPSTSNGGVIDGSAYSSAHTLTAPWDGGKGTQPDVNVPKAFLNYLWINRDYDTASLKFKSKPISTAAFEDGTNRLHELLTITDTISEAGYVYVYLSNDGEEVKEVYFDDFKVQHVKSPVIQSDDYFPFGLRYNSYSRENSLINRSKLFQGQEHVDDLGLNWDSFKWRNHQPEIGRFFNVDPLSEKFYYNSPYAFSENKVTRHVELEGLEAFDIVGAAITLWNAVTHPVSTFNSTQTGQGLQNINQGIQREAGSKVDQALNCGQKIQDAVNEGGSPQKVLAEYQGEQSAGRGQWTTGMMQVGLASGETQMGLFSAALTAGTPQPSPTTKFTVAPQKFDYFFGNVTTGSTHNIQRSAQNLKDLTTLGIGNKQQLTNVFSSAYNSGTFVKSTTSQFGKSIFQNITIGNKGSIDVGFFYKSGAFGKPPSVSTIIPKIYK